VHSDNHDETKRARKIFEEAGAEDISSAGEAGTSRKESDDYASTIR
jgi:hypothetical protein